MLTSDEYVAGLSAATAAVVNRPKREDCPRTNRDPAFSEWKTLVGPDDWKEYSVGKEGAERYRTHNLPDCTSCTGVYELGIVASQSGDGKSDHHSVIPVYVGQADNVRNRLQQYGRDGDHLENSCNNVEFPLKKENGSCQKGCRLFTEAFSRGYSIVYRLALMKSKEDAEKTESRLLKEYDYAWNKYSNGARRRDEVLNKAKPPAIRNLQKGFRIKAPEPDELLEEDDHDTKSSTESIPHVFKFEAIGNPNTICKECRSSSNGYQQISGKACKEHTICGFGLSNGTFCTEKPPEGRKRCEEHKGLRIKEPISQIPDSGCRIKEPINGSATCGATLKDGESCCSRKPAEGSRRCWQHNGHGPTSLPSTCGAPMKSEKDADEKTEARLLNKYDYAWNKDSNGARRHDEVLNKAKPPAIKKLQKGFRIKAPEPDELLEEDDHDTKSSTESIPQVFKFEAKRNPNTICKGKPTVRNIRCRVYKGKIYITYHSLPTWKKEHHYVHGPIIQCRSFSNGYQQIFRKACKEHTICGFGLNNGTFCTEKPPEGRKRCEKHKGLRIKEPISRIPDSACRKGHGDEAVAASPSINGSATCGATLKDGRSCCSMKPTEGSRRCWQHNGHGPTSLQALPSTCGAPTLAGHSCSRQPAAGSMRCWQHCGESSGSLNYYTSSSRSSSCGAPTLAGHSCSRQPAAGSMRCWQHGGESSGSLNYYASSSRSSSCGAPTLAGHSCSRQPAAGSMRCWQHGGESSGSLNYYTSSSRSSLYSSYGSSICGALTRKGYPCSRTAAAGGRCWQHGG